MPDLKYFRDTSDDHLRLVIETGQIGIWELDLDSGQAIRNKVHDEIFGYYEPAGEWTYDMFLERVVDVDRMRVDELQKSAIADKSEWSFQCRIRRMDGQERWISAVGRPLIAPSGEIEKLIGHVIDITDAKQREARLELLTDELNHRVRNLLAVIQSLVKLSASKATDMLSFSEALEGRVSALARSHQLIMSDNSPAMTPSAILEAELTAFADLRERIHVEIDGEPSLSSNASQGLALVFHELITNAIKYGALSIQPGSVRVGIRENDKSVRIAWREENGPEISDIKSAGFGSMLISSALGSSGRVEMNYPASGAECTIHLEVG